MEGSYREVSKKGHPREEQLPKLQREEFLAESLMLLAQRVYMLGAHCLLVESHREVAWGNNMHILFGIQRSGLITSTIY